MKGHLPRHTTQIPYGEGDISGGWGFGECMHHMRGEIGKKS